MVSEIAKREDNYVPVMLVVTDDADKEVRQARIDPVTKRLKVAASFPGNTDGRIKVSANDTTFNYLLAKLVAGTNITLTENNDGGNETITIDAAGASFYTTVEDDTAALTQRPSLNFANYFTLSDNAGNTSTDVAINVTQLAGDATFISSMETNLNLANISGVIDLTTQVTGLLDVTNIDVLALAGDSTFVTALAGDTIFTSALDLGDIGGTLDLTTQVTGILPLANGGTGAALSAPAGDRIYFYDQSAGATAFLTVGSGLDLTGTTLTATATGGSDLQVDVTQVAHGFTAGDVIRSSGVDDTFAKAQADSESNAEVVGLVIAVADVDNFTYTKDVMDYDGAGVPAGTPGNALWLSAATAGAMTMTKPTAVGQVQKPLGQLIASADSINFTADMRGELITNGTSGVTSINNPQLFEDFLTNTVNQTVTSNSFGSALGDIGLIPNANGNSVTFQSTQSQPNAPGILRIDLGGAGAGVEGNLRLNSANVSSEGGIGEIDTVIFSAKARVRFSDATIADFGFGIQDLSNLSANTGIVTTGVQACKFLTVGGNIVGWVRGVSGSPTTVGTFTPVIDTWYDFEIISTGGSYSFYIDDVLQGTISADIPTGIGDIVIGAKASAISQEMHLDYVYYQLSVTR